MRIIINLDKYVDLISWFQILRDIVTSAVGISILARDG